MCFDELVFKYKEEFDQDLGDTSKIVMIGDRLTTDVFFGNDNNMATVYVHKFYHFWMNLRINPVGFHILQLEKEL